MKTIIALLATLLFTATVKADTSHVVWTFQVLDQYHYSDYSNDPYNTVAMTLPVEAVKAGWSCIREPIQSFPNEEMGWVVCSNGKESHYVVASCKTDRINTDYERKSLDLPGAPSGYDISITCVGLR